jgi:hypothetical protein
MFSLAAVCKDHLQQGRNLVIKSSRKGKGKGEIMNIDIVCDMAKTTNLSKKEEEQSKSEASPSTLPPFSHEDYDALGIEGKLLYASTLEDKVIDLVRFECLTIEQNER